MTRTTRQAEAQICSSKRMHTHDGPYTHLLLLRSSALKALKAEDGQGYVGLPSGPDGQRSSMGVRSCPDRSGRCPDR